MRFFPYVTNTQAYQRKSENEEKQSLVGLAQEKLKNLVFVFENLLRLLLADNRWGMHIRVVVFHRLHIDHRHCKQNMAGNPYSFYI